VGELKV